MSQPACRPVLSFIYLDFGRNQVYEKCVSHQHLAELTSAADVRIPRLQSETISYPKTRLFARVRRRHGSIVGTGIST